MSSIEDKEWKLIKTVLPQHTDHAGIMWHGSYLNFLEEGRIDALNRLGISYKKLCKKGFEIPVVSIKIRYKMPFLHGESFVLMSKFKLENKIRLNCETLFLKLNGDIGAEAKIGLVVVKKRNESINIVRKLPVEIINLLLLLEDGPKD